MEKQLTPSNSPDLLDDEQSRVLHSGRQALEQLLCAFAPEMVTPFLRRFKTMDPGNDCLQQLLLSILSGEWKPQKLPVHLATVCLEYPRAILDVRCSSCKLLLPRLQGHWSNSVTKQYLFTERNFFLNCPVCTGELRNRFFDGPLTINGNVPLAPEPPWEFHELNPGIRK